MKRTLLILLIAGSFAGACGKKTVKPATPAKGLPFKVIQVPEKPKAPAQVFFTGSGPQKEWTLTMTNEEIKFISKDKAKDFALPFVAPVMERENNRRIYKLAATDRTIEITIEEGVCTDSLLSVKSEHTVKISQRSGDAEATILNGCGNYVPDEILNSVWVLQELRGQKALPTEFGNELPYIDIHTDISSFTGFAGCNRIKGRIKVYDNNVLNFSEIVATKMACLAENKENIFLQALQSTTKTELQGRLLILSNKSGVQAVLYKKT